MIESFSSSFLLIYHLNHVVQAMLHSVREIFEIVRKRFTFPGEPHTARYDQIVEKL